MIANEMFELSWKLETLEYLNAPVPKRIVVESQRIASKDGLN